MGVYLTLAFSRPRSVVGALPVASTTAPGRMVFSELPYLKVSLGLNLSCSRATTLQVGRMVIPKSLVR